MKVADYPKDTNEQSAKAVEVVKDLVAKVLGRDEPFSLVVRKSAQRRYAKDSTLVLVPPIEVRIIIDSGYKLAFGHTIRLIIDYRYA